MFIGILPGLSGQGIYLIEQQEVCWNTGAIDSTVMRVMIISSRTPDYPSIMGYTDASGNVVSVSGGIVSLGSCDSQAGSPTIENFTITQNGCEIEVTAVLTNTDNAGQITLDLDGTPQTFYFDVGAQTLSAQITSPGGSLDLVLTVTTGSGSDTDTITTNC